MNRAAVNNATSVDASKVEIRKALSRRDERGVYPGSEQKSDFLSFADNGFNLTQVPARPVLHTGMQVQCCAKDGEDCSCPKCRKEAGREETGAGSGEEPETAADSSPEQTADESSEQPAEEEKTPAVNLIVEDSVEKLQEGQMKKMPFLQKLREAICNAIGPVLAKKGRTTDGCPYLNYWFDTYQSRSPTDIEQTLRRYAPDAVNATTASEYISIVAQRALKAAEDWASTGEMPGDLPTALPDGASSTDGQESAVQAKAKSGGVRQAGDPAGIQKELGEGRPLDGDVRSRMESAFGVSFSHVRTHTDGNASDVSNRVNARAFTVGNHVAFGNGEYRPGTVMGDALIAHELAHTIQQSGAGKTVDKMEMGSSGYEALEADADQAAAGAVGLLWKGNQGGLKGVGQKALSRLRSGLTLQRCCTETKPPPTLTLTEIKSPASSGCGSIEWPVRFGLSGANKDTEGWIIQEVHTKFNVKDCDNQPIDVKKYTGALVGKTIPGGGVQNVIGKATDPDWWPMTEAWRVKKGQVFQGDSSKPHNADTYQTPLFNVNDNKGSIAITGTVDYFDCIDLPSGFDTGKEPSPSLPIAKPPNMPSGGSGAKKHNLTIEWNCCPGAKPDEKTTRATSKDP